MATHRLFHSLLPILVTMAFTSSVASYFPRNKILPIYLILHEPSAIRTSHVLLTVHVHFNAIA
jgi:hypothetical protein